MIKNFFVSVLTFLQPISDTNNSVGSQTAAVGNVQWPTRLAAAICDSTLLFVAEKGFTIF